MMIQQESELEQMQGKGYSAMPRKTLAKEGH